MWRTGKKLKLILKLLKRLIDARIVLEFVLCIVCEAVVGMWAVFQVVASSITNLTCDLEGRLPFKRL